MGEKLHRREENNPDPLLRSLIKRKCERLCIHLDNHRVGLETAIFDDYVTVQ